MTDLEWITCNDCPTTPARVIGEAYDADPVSRHCDNCDGKGGWFACSWCGKPEGCKCFEPVEEKPLGEGWNRWAA